jgi:hypothetical protein
MPISMLLKNLAEGMVTAEPVFNHLGQLLLDQGLSLSTRHLTVLKTWGIEKCLVEGGDPAVNPEVNEALRTRARERVRARLLWEPQNVWDREIIQIAVHQAICRSLRDTAIKK